MAMMVSGVRLFELTSTAVGARACADGRLICVGILTAFYFVIEIQEGARRLTQGSWASKSRWRRITFLACRRRHRCNAMMRRLKKLLRFAGRPNVSGVSDAVCNSIGPTCFMNRLHVDAGKMSANARSACEWLHKHGSAFVQIGVRDLREILRLA